MPSCYGPDADIWIAAERAEREKKAARKARRDFSKFGPGLLAKYAPPSWFDDRGVERHTPTIRGRLKSKILGHRALMDFVLRRDGACVACGDSEATGVRMVVDHIISRRNGGAHHPNNLQALCDGCNSAKVGLIDVRAVSVSLP
jgi:hypothetical protein